MPLNFEEPPRRTSTNEVVETTSLAAAKAMARYYLEQDQPGLTLSEHDLISNSPYVATRQEEGRTVYAIRPRPGLDTSSPTFGTGSRRHSHSSGLKQRPSMLFAHKPLEKKSSTKTLRSWRSNPQLRSPNEPPLSKTLLFPDEGGFYRPTTSFEHIPDSNDPLLYLQLPRNTHSHHLLTPNHNSTTPAAVLNLGNNSTKRSRSSSIPLLSHCSTSNLSARGMLSGPVQPISSTATNDVLGQILGWSTTMLSAKPSTSTLSPSKRSQATPKVSSSASRLKHVSSVSYSSSADAGDEASQEGSFDHSSYEKRSQTDEVLPIDLQEELAESHEQSPPHSPGPSTPTLTLSNVRSLNYFPSNESNTVRFEPDQSNASKSSAGSPRQTKTPPQSNESPARVPPLIHQSPFGQGVKLKSRTLKRKKPLPQSESAHAIETSFLEIAQGSDERSHSRFQDTAIFDVLQALELHADAFTYDGGAAVSMDSLPGLSALNKGQFHRHSRAGSTSSLLSVSSNASSLLPRNAQQITVSAAPSDDPRFVIWGEKQPTTSSKPSLTSQDSSSVLSSTASPATSRRWSRKASTSSHDPAVKHASSFQTVLPPQKMLMAATVERWVAELTSKIDPELLADFFLAYRSFLSPYSLCELLVTRFNWALAEPSSPEDEAARRIVRVRSFVVIRHWLLNYFIEDFVPDSQLRGLLTSWLNNTAKSYQIKSSPSDQRLVKNLKKVVRRLKDQYVNIGSALEQGAAQLSAALDSQSAGDAGIHSQSSGPAIVLDEDVDLNFTTYNTSHAPHQRSVSAGRKGTEGMLLPVSPPKERRRSTTASSREVLHDRLGQTGKLVKTHPSTTSPSRAAHPSTYLPVSHSPVSRAVTSTLGQFGRLKRMIQNRSSPTVASEELASHDGPAVDVFSQVQTESSSNPSSPSIHQSSSASMTSTSEVETPDEGDILTSPEVSDTSNTSSSGLGISRSMEAEDPMLRHSLSNQTIKSDLRASKGKRVSQSLNSEPPAHAPPKQSSTWTSSAGHRASVVQLDDVGLSDESDDEEVELPRTLRRLPAARDLRQAEALRQLRPQTSKATMSSLATRKSSRLFKRPSFASFRSGSSNHSQDSADEHAPGVITNFVIDGLESDDEEESGDVEAALRRLEGQIDSEKQKIKAARVERQMAKSAAAADSGLEPQHESADEQDDNPVGETRTPRSSASADPEEQARSAVVSTLINPEIGDSASSGPRMLTPEPPGLNAPDLPHDMRSSSPAHHSSSEVPAKTRLSTLRLSMGRKPSIRNLLSRTHPPLETAGPQSKLSIPPTMQPAHRSFVLLCKTEVLARQFCLIERDLLSNISWHELVHGVWRNRDTQLDVLDWEQFIKSRARQLVEAREKGVQLDSTEVGAAIARFNLVANWVASEIVMTTSLDERVALVGKFIRLAWKCYRQSNFQSLTQVIHGLQSIYVERLRKTWARVGMWEMRVFRDLKTFTSHIRNFRSLRNVTDSLAESWGPPGQGSASADPHETSRRTSFIHSGTVRGESGVQSAPSGCIPFLGLFLRDLAISSELPTFLDATSPTTPASMDPVSNQLDVVADPQAFSDLPPIPDQYQHYPLVNVHKARTISSIVQKVLVFQEMATCYPYEADAVLFRKCLALRCLSVEGQRSHSFQLEG